MPAIARPGRLPRHRPANLSHRRQARHPAFVSARGRMERPSLHRRHLSGRPTTRAGPPNVCVGWIADAGGRGASKGLHTRHSRFRPIPSSRAEWRHAINKPENRPRNHAIQPKIDRHQGPEQRQPNNGCDNRHARVMCSNPNVRNGWKTDTRQSSALQTGTAPSRDREPCSGGHPSVLLGGLSERLRRLPSHCNADGREAEQHHRPRGGFRDRTRHGGDKASGIQLVVVAEAQRG